MSENLTEAEATRVATPKDATQTSLVETIFFVNNVIFKSLL